MSVNNKLIKEKEKYEELIAKCETYDGDTLTADELNKLKEFSFGVINAIKVHINIKNKNSINSKYLNKIREIKSGKPVEYIDPKILGNIWYATNDIIQVPNYTINEFVIKNYISIEKKLLENKEITEITSTGSVGGAYEVPFGAITKKDFQTLENMKKKPLNEQDQKDVKQELINEFIYPSKAAKATEKNKGGAKNEQPKKEQPKGKSYEYPATPSKETRKNTATPGKPDKKVTVKGEQIKEKHDSKASETTRSYMGGEKSPSKSFTTNKEAKVKKNDGPKVVEKTTKGNSFTPPKNVSKEHYNDQLEKFINATGLQHLDYDNITEETLEKIKDYLKAGDKSENGLASNPNSTVGQKMINSSKVLKDKEEEAPEIVSLGDDIELTGKKVKKTTTRISDKKAVNEMKTIQFKSFIFEDTEHGVNNIPEKYKNTGVVLEMKDANNNSIIVECKEEVKVLSTFSKGLDLMSENIDKFNQGQDSKKQRIDENQFFKANFIDIKSRLLTEWSDQSIEQSILPYLNAEYSKSPILAKTGMEKYAHILTSANREVEVSPNNDYSYLPMDDHTMKTFIYSFPEQKFYFMSLIDWNKSSDEGTFPRMLGRVSEIKPQDNILGVHRM